MEWRLGNGAVLAVTLGWVEVGAGVGAHTAREAVAARAAGQSVVAATAAEQVIAGQGVDRVVAVLAEQQVGARGAGQVVRAVAGGLDGDRDAAGGLPVRDDDGDDGGAGPVSSSVE